MPKRLVLKNCRSSVGRLYTEFQSVRKHCKYKTVRQELHKLGFYGWAAAHNQYITKINASFQLNFCKEQLHWTSEQWKQILWSDESCFTICQSWLIWYRLYDDSYVLHLRPETIAICRWMIMVAKMYLGMCVAQISWHLSYSWGKIPEKTLTKKLTWLGIKSGPTVWEATTLPLDHSDGPVSWKGLVMGDTRWTPPFWVCSPTTSWEVWWRRYHGMGSFSWYGLGPLLYFLCRKSWRLLDIKQF